MPASFQLSPSDFLLFQRAAWKRLTWKHGRFSIPFFLSIFAWLCFATATMAYLKIWEQRPATAQPFGFLIALFVMAFLSAVVMPYVAQKRFMRYAVHAKGSFLAPQKVEATEDALLFTFGESHSHVPWSSVLGRVEDSRNHYLFIDAMYALIIPKAVIEAIGPTFATKLKEIPLEA